MFDILVAMQFLIYCIQHTNILFKGVVIQWVQKTQQSKRGWTVS